MKKQVLIPLLLFFLLICCPCVSVYAEELSSTLVLSNGESPKKLTDASHYTSVSFRKNDTVTVSAANQEAIHSLYISWDSLPTAWTLTTDSGEILCGRDGFLHEYILLDTPSSSVTIHIPEHQTRIDAIRIFGSGELPADVQVWEPPCERADILVVSSHADDEILFMGGILPTYSYLHDAAIQIVYMCEFYSSNRVREHEKLDGLWEAGIRSYPVCGNFYDKYSKSLDAAKDQYVYDDLVSYLVSEIRRFRPQVIVTHDIFGEYGHGFHMLTCQAVMKSVELAASRDADPDTASLYGVWDTPKTYLHIFPVNSITLDLHVPIEEDYAGRTALDILKAAFKKHVSQQGPRFYVSDDYEHSCADFGLYRTLVGPDTTNDLLCNLKTYAVMEQEEALRREAEALAAKKAEEERLAAEEAAKKAKEEEQLAAKARLEAEQALAAKKAEEERLAAEEAQKKEAEILQCQNTIQTLQNSLNETRQWKWVFGILSALLTPAFLCLLFLVYRLKRKEETLS